MYQPDRVILIDLIGNESMITNLNIIHYRKLKNLSLAFKPGINLISGTNGTCKSSILHIIGNAFQRFKRTSDGVDSSSLSVINAINKYTNPKVENLTKGDKTYNDPAKGTEGELFNIQLNNETYAFRRHNSTDESEEEGAKNRFRLILKYPRGEKQSLPFGMVIYLGLSRIVPVGELEDYTEEIKKNLPAKYQDELISLYQKMTDISITEPCIENSNEIKHRISFKSEVDGIDSDTISAGEDNIMIILTALVSLKYHFESCSNEEYKKSYLLIDEFDATLHPSLQFKLLSLLREFSRDFNIQIIFTTHSLYLIDKALKAEDNIIYLMKLANNSVAIMQNPDIFKIEMHLNSETRQDLYRDKKLPIFSEDNEARIMINFIFDILSEKDQKFASVRHYFHLVQMKSGCDNLKTLFKDKVLTANTLKAMCILDGDNRTHELTHNIISLPGQASPEKLTFQHLSELISKEIYNDFWCNEYLQQEGYSFEWVKSNVFPRASGLVSAYDRDKAKSLFNEQSYHHFFTIVMKDWLLRHWEDREMKGFIKDLNILFHNLADYYGIHTAYWPRL